MANSKKQHGKTARNAIAVHAEVEDHHVVGFGNLRVVICAEDGVFGLILLSYSHKFSIALASFGLESDRKLVDRMNKGHAVSSYR